MEQHARNVEDKLIESFKQLALTMPVDKITIKDITDGAGVIRTTFYYHYEDKYQLIEKILVRDVVEPIVPLLENGMVDELILLIFKNLDRQKPFFRALCKMDGPITFRQLSTRVIAKMLAEYLEGKVTAQGMELLKEKYQFLNPELIIDYYAHNIVYITTTWVLSDVEVTPEQAAKILRHLLNHSVAETFNDLTQNS